MKEIDKSTDIIYKELEKYNFGEQLDILRDCGLSCIVDSHKPCTPKKSFKLILRGKIDSIKERCGNKIKGGNWEGIFDTLTRD